MVVGELFSWSRRAGCLYAVCCPAGLSSVSARGMSRGTSHAQCCSGRSQGGLPLPLLLRADHHRFRVSTLLRQAASTSQPGDAGLEWLA